MTEWSLFFFQGKPFSITVFQVYASTTNGKEAETEQFYEDLQDLLELTHTQKCPFHHRGLEFKSRKSRDTWSNWQIWPWSTKWSKTKANRVLPRECTGHSRHSLPTTSREDSTHGQMVNSKIRFIIFSPGEDGEALCSEQKQDWELTVAQIMDSLLQNSELNWRK